jgi:hypothetical protein
MCKPLVPHKWVDVIHAWADGLAVQALINGVWSDIKHPTFGTSTEWRIKPAPITKEQARAALDDMYTCNYPPSSANMKLVWDFLHQDD